MVYRIPCSSVDGIGYISHVQLNIGLVQEHFFLFFLYNKKYKNIFSYQLFLK